MIALADKREIYGCCHLLKGYAILERVHTEAGHINKPRPITVENDTIRIDESAMSYDTEYPIQLADGTKYEVVFTSDGAIEIYEVAP